MHANLCLTTTKRRYEDDYIVTEQFLYRWTCAACSFQFPVWWASTLELSETARQSLDPIRRPPPIRCGCLQQNNKDNSLLYPPTERSELARYHVILFSFRPSVCAHSVFRCKYLENEIEAWYQLPTNRKWPMADRMMTSSMTSHDPERSKSWPSYFMCTCERDILCTCIMCESFDSFMSLFAGAAV